MKPLISFVIPAYNAEQTIRRTLSSLAAQGERRWEALVVDDGSTDRTAAVVNEAAQSDGRITLLTAAHGGVSRARNAGIAKAQGEWLVFLDADDTLEHDYLEVMQRAAGDGAAFVYCGHRRVLPDGTELNRGFEGRLEHNAFDVLAHHCALAIHAVLMRRSILENVGGFDPELRICEDWDLWQRIARTGVQMKGVRRYLALYQQESGSLSKKNVVLLMDGLKVLRRGCGPDERVRQPHARWAQGLGMAQYGGRAAHLAVWCSAVEIGAGGHGADLLQHLDVPFQLPDGGWEEIANAIVDGLSVGSATRSERVAERYAEFRNPLEQLVERISHASADAATAETLHLQIERLLVMRRPVGRAADGINLTAAVGVDLRSVDAQYPVGSADRAVVSLYAGRKALPSVYLPVEGGLLRREEIVDAAVRKMGVLRYVAHSRAWLHPRFCGHLAMAVARSCSRRVLRPLLMRKRPRFSAKVEVRQVLTYAALRSAQSASVGAPGSVAPLGPGVARAARGLLALGGKKPPQARREVWEQQFSEPDPWKYTTDYERVKYERTLQLLQGLPASRVLELACAEGHFTKLLAPHVKLLVSADISATALARAQQRCADAPNVEFQQVDLLEDSFPGDMDIVLCSEVLNYMGGIDAVRSVLQKIQNALRPGGCLVMANLLLLKEDMARTGFDWDQDYGGKTIYETAATLPGFVAEKAIVTELYRIDCFRKTEAPLRNSGPQTIELPLDCALEPELARYVVWGGAQVRRSEVQHRHSWALPVLTYHRVAPEGPDSLRQWRVTPEAFREQLRYLRAQGFRAITSQDLALLREGNKPVQGRPIMITFDDGYQDFEDHAWPILVENDFNPEVFLVTDRIGGHADWDTAHGEPARLMGWESITRLHREGVSFGSHLASHRPATSLTSAELAQELLRSKVAIEDKLNSPVRSVAAPHGLFDERFAPLAVRAGYSVGYSCRTALADLRSPDFFVNRIEVPGSWDEADFSRCVMQGIDSI